ncbi:MAG: zinc metallopeptidase [Oscillospiraceae bacterium]|nr:zinc metallopeptidase [Oscillospiraceae bacterium]
MYFDWTYIVLLTPALIFSMWASSRVNSTYRKFSQQYSRRGISAAQAARAVLNANGLGDVAIEHISGNLTDHYDPSARIIRLSDGVYSSSSSAAIGIACHEVGHAIQHAQGYGPLRLRNAIVPITNFGAKLSTPLIILGLLLSSLSYNYISISYLGIICFALCTFFQLITLPVEFNASRRAMDSISSQGLLYEDEMEGTRKVLGAAALTYVAALAVSMMQLLRFVLLVGGRRRD